MRLTLSIVVLLFIVSSMITAQDAPTTTPAPTKTPVETTSEATNEPTVAPENVEGAITAQPLARAFNQDDLQILVGNVQRPNGMTWFDGKLFTGCVGDYTLYQIDAITGQTITLVYGVQNAHTLFAEEDGQGFNLFVPDFDTNRLVRVDETRSAPRAVADGLNGPWGITYKDADNFLVSNIRGNNIVTVSREGDISSYLEGLRAPAGIVLSEDKLFVVNNGSARRAIEWIEVDESGAPVGEPAALVSGLQNASSLVLAPDGLLYFTFALGTRGVVGRVNAEECLGGCTNEDVEIVVYTDLQAPLAGLTISPDMRLYVHTIFRPELYYVDVYGN
jgi:glucose/arabinose dehydrogenase